MSDSEIPETKTKQPVSLCGVMSDSEIQYNLRLRICGKEYKNKHALRVEVCVGV